MKNLSLKKQTIMVILILTAICIACSAFISSQILNKHMMRKYETDKETFAEVLSYSLSPMLHQYEFKELEGLIASSLKYSEIASIKVFDPNKTLLKSAVEEHALKEDLDFKERMLTTSLEGIIGSIEIGFSKAYIAGRIRTATMALIMALTGAFILIGFGLYSLMERSIVGPLEDFTQTVKEMGSDNLSTRVTIKKNDEIGVLAISFNQMAENLETHQNYLEDLVKQRTIDLEKSISLLTATIESTADGILALDGNRKVSAYNKKFMELWNLPDHAIESEDDNELLQSMANQLNTPRDFLMGVEILYAQPDKEKFDVLEFRDGSVFEQYSTPQNLGDDIIGRVWSFRDITEKKRAERALKESEDRLRLALKGGELGFWDVNLETDESIFNDRWAEMLGYSLDEIEKTRATWINAIHPDDRERIMKFGEEYRKGRKSDYEVEYRAITKEGNVIWQISKGAAVEKDKNGHARRMVGTVMDITKRKKMEKELKDQAMFLDAVFENAPIVMMLIDEENKIKNINLEGVRTVKREKEELLGLPFGEVLRCINAYKNEGCGMGDECMKCPIRSSIIHTFQTGENIFNKEGQFIVKSDDTESEFFFHISTSLITFEKKSNVLMILDDVTERKEAEEVIKKDHRALQALFKLGMMKGATKKKLVEYLLEELVSITDSEIGYLHFVNPDEESISLYAWSKGAPESCKTVMDPHYPLSKAGVWADCIRQRKPVIHNNYPLLEDKKNLPEWHVPILRHMSVPIYDRNQIVAIAGVGNKRKPYNERNVFQMTQLVSNLWEILQRTNAEKALRKNEERLSIAVETGNLGMWQWDIGTEELIVDDKWTEITGFKDPEDRKALEEKIHPDDKGLLEEQIKMHLQGKTDRFVQDFRIHHPEKGWVWLHGIGRVIERDKGGNPLLVIGLHQDITDHKKAEADLIKRAEELEVFNKSMVDREMKIIEMKEEVNQLCREIGRDPIYPAVWAQKE